MYLTEMMPHEELRVVVCSRTVSSHSIDHLFSAHFYCSKTNEDNTNFLDYRVFGVIQYEDWVRLTKHSQMCLGDSNELDLVSWLKAISMFP